MKLFETSLLWRINICLMILATLLFIIGFATDHLIDFYHGHVGLWKLCGSGKCFKMNTLIDESDKFKDEVLASRYILIISLCTQFLAICVNLAMLAVSNTRVVSIVGATLAFFAVLTAVVGSSVFMVRTTSNIEDYAKHGDLQDSPAWSFILLMAGCGGYFLSGLLQVMDVTLCRDNRNSNFERMTNEQEKY